LPLAGARVSTQVSDRLPKQNRIHTLSCCFHTSDDTNILHNASKAYFYFRGILAVLNAHVIASSYWV